MLNLDAVTLSGELADPEYLYFQLEQLRKGEVDGIMADVWWGATEPRPKSYRFQGYKRLVNMCKELGLKVQFVTSFHQCGGNVGDLCNLPLPAFVSLQTDIWYKDKHGHEDYEYISLFADNVTIGGRTPLQMYSDWFEALASAFEAELGSVITEIQVGMGPAGELRYPAYQLSEWTFCGIGEFQCFDTHALRSLAAAANSTGHENWGWPPVDVGEYNSRPETAAFFQEGYTSDYGRFFLKWYSGELIRHGAEVLGLAKKAFSKFDVNLAGKVAGIHWWYKTSHHAAELTAGYYNANGHDGYGAIAEAFMKVGASVDFTCLEMTDFEQSAACLSSPEELSKQVFISTVAHGISLGGENAMARFDDRAYRRIESYKSGIRAFTYLRLSRELILNLVNWDRFKAFVRNMHDEKGVIV